jgi:hypothetical protein
MTTRPGYVWDATASEWVEIGQAAVLAPIKYQTSQPSSPATGDIWIDSDDEVPSVDSTLYYRWTKTMSGGETSLSGTDNNSLALKYTPGYESVFINGVLQVRGSDYVATTGTTVTGLIALTASDVVMVESIIAYSVGDTYTQTTLDGKFSPITTTGLVLLNTTSFTAQSTVSIDNVFSSAYTNYRIILDYKGDSAATGCSFRLRTTSDDASSVYDKQELLATSTTVVGGLYTAQTSWSISGGNRTYFMSSVDIYSPNLNTPTRLIGQTTSADANWASAITMMVGCEHRNNYQATGFSSIMAANSTGTIKVYGYK